MIESSFIYLAFLFGVSISLYILNLRYPRFFKYIPAVVLLYLVVMLFSMMGFFAKTLDGISSDGVRFLLPAMLFLILLNTQIKAFFSIGKKLLIAYLLSLFSIVASFVIVAIIFRFDESMARAFGSLSGSWMGGMANMIAISSALEVPKELFSYILIVDSINYTLWVMFLLFLIPLSHRFNLFTNSSINYENLSFNLHSKNSSYVLPLFLAMGLSLAFNYLTTLGFVVINVITTTVILATIFGILASFSRLREYTSASSLSSILLYMLIALIGSQAVFEDFGDAFLWVFIGSCILFFHMLIMVIGAKIFRLDLFSISVASLANIGGVASASLLAASYDKKLTSIGALMAIMGYIVGTVGGLMVARVLISLTIS